MPAVRSRAPVTGSTRLCVRPLVCWTTFPLARALPSTPSTVSAWACLFRIAHGSFVRSLLWSYGPVRLPVSVPHDRVRGVHRADLGAIAKGRHRASRVPHTLLPCMPGVCDPARDGDALPERRARCGLPRVRSASAPRTRPMSGLSTRPARSPINASRSSLPRLAHDAGPAWVATPSLSETSTPSHCAGLSRHTRTPGIRRGGKRERSGRCTPSPACLG